MCRVVVRGCFQNVEKSEEDNLFASTPSLATMRLLLCMALVIGASLWVMSQSIYVARLLRQNKKWSFLTYFSRFHWLLPAIA